MEDLMGRARKQSADITPSPHRLLESLRDVGYDFVTAVADIVDNSITAGAQRISVDIAHQEGPPRVTVADDGHGMTRSRLVESLRLGSMREYELDDLGKFGLGLKTASLSQCRRLTVATRHSPNQYRISAATLDLDDIASENRWRLNEHAGTEIHQIASKWLLGTTGTVVVWQKLDRVVRGGNELGGWDRRRLRNFADSTVAHLSMVFHRFLEGTHGLRRLRMSVNSTKLEAWNPYAVDETHSQAMPEQHFEFSTPAGQGDVHVRGHVLPPRDLFSTSEAFEHLSGPRKWNRQQGFYIYRNNRLIQSGGWCGLRAADEHTKLARISIDFPSSLDDLFNVNIAKMRVSIPSELKVLLERVVLDVVKNAQAAYRGPLRVVSPDEDPERENAPRTIARAPQAPAYGDFMLALRAAAMATGEGKSLSKILARLRLDAPDLAASAGLAVEASKSSEKHRSAP